jgi:hypothetical protein
MKTTSAKQARANIIAAYEPQHREGVSALSSAIERAKATGKDAKAETMSESKPSLASLLLAVQEE